jgi:hypothetical protein
VKRIAIILVLLCAQAAAADRIVTIQPIGAYSGRSVTLDGTKPYTVTPTPDGKTTVTQGSHVASFAQLSFAARTVGTWPACPTKPPVATRSVQCPAGTTGAWTQTQDFATAPYPQCWTVLPWAPTSPPAGACTPTAPPPPPTGQLSIDLSYVDQSSTAFAKFKQYVDRAVAGHPDYLFSATDAAYMFKLTGQQQYATLAVSMVDQQVSSAESAIAAGHNPDVAGDSYLGVGGMIGDLAITQSWCNPTAAQVARWRAYAAQAIFNVWHPSAAAWGGRSAPWSGWAVNDPANNYYYSFLRATMFYALAVNDADLLTYLRTDRLPLLTNFYATIPGGGSLEGTGYGTSHMGLFELYQVWKDSGQGDLANASAHLTNSIRVWANATVPTMDKFAPFGDQARVSEPAIYDYQRRVIIEAQHQTNDPDAATLGAWWLGAINNGGAGQDQMQSSFNYRYNLTPHPLVNTPPAALTYRAPETGFTFARTGWMPNATWLAIAMGLYDQSHAHQEQGGFTLYKGTWLAVTNNIWSHSGINQSTQDKNVVRFEKAGAIQPQRQCDTCKVNVTSYQANVNGDLHITGDVTPLYAASTGVTRWLRTIDFVSGVTTITDDVATASGTTAIWQINVPVQPTVQGNVVTAGALRMSVLNPSGAQISVVDMRTVAGSGGGAGDYNKGWRIDLRGGSSYRVVLEPQ